MQKIFVLLKSDRYREDIIAKFDKETLANLEICLFPNFTEKETLENVLVTMINRYKEKEPDCLTVIITPLSISGRKITYETIAGYTIHARYIVYDQKKPETFPDSVEFIFSTVCIEDVLKSLITPQS